MTNIEILEKAWHQAINNGFKPIDTKHLIVTDNVTGERFGYETWIYDHDFAKAIWGERQRVEVPNQVGLGGGTWSPGWEDHLKNMVVADDPIAYLGEHL
jgi:hypothetical protein